MDVRITEAELDFADVQFVRRVLLVRREGEDPGVSVYEVGALAPPGPPPSDDDAARFHMLLVEVEEPEHAGTQVRVRSKFLERLHV
jgi:hypothetical protein